ncbi:MAG: hypothetical protein QM473_15250 [Acidobacteriota bacterium]|nr:hypothetical protein [Acidobacteriota bacterium]
MDTDAGQVPETSPEAVPEILALPETAPEYDGTQTGGPVMVTFAQAAELLGKPEKTLRNRAAAGKGLPDGWRYLADRRPKMLLVPDVRTLQVPDELPAKSGETEILPGGAGSAVPEVPVVLPAENAEIQRLQEALAASEADRRRLWEHVEHLTKALPPAREVHQDAAAVPEQVMGAIAELRDAVEQQARENAALREKLENARRPWWRRLLGGRDPENG